MHAFVELIHYFLADMGVFPGDFTDWLWDLQGRIEAFGKEIVAFVDAMVELGDMMYDPA